MSINRNTYLDIVMRTGAANEANLLHDEFTGNAVAEVTPRKKRSGRVQKDKRD